MAPLGTEVDSHVQSCLGQKRPMCGTSLVVQWLRLSASTAENESFIPDKVTKIPHIKLHGKRKVQCEAFMTQAKLGNSQNHSHHHYGYVHNGAIMQSISMAVFLWKEPANLPHNSALISLLLMILRTSPQGFPSHCHL